MQHDEHFSEKPSDVSRDDATRRLVDSFSQIPTRWIEELAQARGAFLPLPMWGTVFMPNDTADVSNIQRLLRSIETTDNDDEAFADAGWREVTDTGIYAIEFDGGLLLGIHGAGYSFYDHHWSKLYDALGYHWHTD
jgi:hypothetical protein